jgi:16S rRNA (guanine(527)-N(7))-methyltransferase RsmG
MPNASGAGDRGPALPPDFPPDLEQDFRTFADELARVASSFGSTETLRRLAADRHALARLIRLAVLLHQQSDRLALVARGDRRRIFTRHILDSLNPLSLFSAAPSTLLDVGSGAGLPGIPLAIAWPYTRITLLESRERKVAFLERVVREAELLNVRVVCARLEEAGSRWSSEPFEAVAIRALGGIADLLRSASCIAAPASRWIYFLGDPARADALRASVEASARDVAVARGAFGGWLLTGRFS